MNLGEMRWEQQVMNAHPSSLSAGISYQRDQSMILLLFSWLPHCCDLSECVIVVISALDVLLWSPWLDMGEKRWERRVTSAQLPSRSVGIGYQRDPNYVSLIFQTNLTAISLWLLLPYRCDYCCCRVVVVSPIVFLLWLLLLQGCCGFSTRLFLWLLRLPRCCDFGGCCIFVVPMAAVLLWFPRSPYCCDNCVTVVMIYAAAVFLWLFLLLHGCDFSNWIIVVTFLTFFCGSDRFTCSALTASWLDPD